MLLLSTFSDAGLSDRVMRKFKGNEGGALPFRGLNCETTSPGHNFDLEPRMLVMGLGGFDHVYSKYIPNTPWSTQAKALSFKVAIQVWASER